MKIRIRGTILLAVFALTFFAFFSKNEAEAAGRIPIATAAHEPAKGITVKLNARSFQYRGGQRIVPTFTVKYGKKLLKEGTDYTFWTGNAKNVGTATLTVKGKGRYEGSLRVSYRIVQRKAANISSRTKYSSCAYTGKARKPALVIGFKVGEKTIRLKEGRDFTRKYRDNIYPGTGTVIVKYQGNYTGKVALTFKIKAPVAGKYPVEPILALGAGTVLPENAIDGQNLQPYFTVDTIAAGDAVYNRIIGKSYRENPNIGLKSLRYLKLLHRNYDGKIQVGELVCAAAIAEDLRSIFRELFEIGYQLYSVRLVDEYWTGDGLTTDEASVRANNTSAFNYRRASDAPSLSNHAFGRAVDINPRHNPYIRLQNGVWMTDPPILYEQWEFGYPDPNVRPGLALALSSADPCVQIFKRHGFTWGGDWSGASRDYQHFEKTI